MFLRTRSLANPGAIHEDATILTEVNADIVLSAAWAGSDTNKVCPPFSRCPLSVLKNCGNRAWSPQMGGLPCWIIMHCMFYYLLTLEYFLKLAKYNNSDTLDPYGYTSRCCEDCAFQEVQGSGGIEEEGRTGWAR